MPPTPKKSRAQRHHPLGLRPPPCSQLYPQRRFAYHWSSSDCSSNFGDDDDDDAPRDAEPAFANDQEVAMEPDMKEGNNLNDPNSPADEDTGHRQTSPLSSPIVRCHYIRDEEDFGVRRYGLSLCSTVATLLDRAKTESIEEIPSASQPALARLRSDSYQSGLRIQDCIQDPFYTSASQGDSRPSLPPDEFEWDMWVEIDRYLASLSSGVADCEWIEDKKTENPGAIHVTKA